MFNIKYLILFSENGDLYAWGDNTSGKLTLRDISQCVKQPKTIPILKGKSVNCVALGLDTTIFSTSAFEKSIVYKETQPQI